MIPPVITEVAFTTDPGSTPTWTDISAYVKRSAPVRGRDDEFGDFGPGTNQLTLDNRDRRFDPSYTAGPYYGNLLPMRRLRQRIAGNQIGTEFWGDFEQGADGTAPEWTSGNGALEIKAGREAACLSYVTSPLRLGARAAKFLVASGDQFGTSTGERALARRGTQNNAFPTANPEGAVAYYQFSFRPEGAWTHPTGWEIFQEFKSDARYGQPIVALETNQARTKFDLSFVTGNFPTATDATNGTNASQAFDFIGPDWAVDVWWDVRFAVKWTTTSSGFFVWQMKQSTDSAWMTYGEKYDFQTLPTTTGDATPPGLNEFIGFYRNASAFTNVVYHDGYQVGHSWNDVSYTGFPVDSRWNDKTWEGAPNLLDTQSAGGYDNGNVSGATTTGGGITRVSDSSRFKFGPTALKVTTDGGGSGQGVRHFKANGSTRFDVTAGRTYTFTQWYSCDTGETVRTGIEWFDSGGSSISTSSGLNKATRSDFRRHWVTATAPANAVTARLESRWAGTTAGTFWVAGVGFWEGTLDHVIFDGYVDSWTQAFPDRLFDIETVVPCSDGRKVLNLLAQPTSNPSVESFADVVDFYQPSVYYRMGEPAGTKLIIQKRKKKHRRHKKEITAADLEGVSGPSGTYVNTPTLGQAGVVAGDMDTAVRFTEAQSEYAKVVFDSESLGGGRAVTVMCWINAASSMVAGSVPLVTGPRHTASIAPIFDLGVGAGSIPVFGVNLDDGTRPSADASTSLSTAIWYFLVGIYDGTNVYIYIDSVLRATTATSGAALRVGNTGELRLAAGDAVPPTNFFDGTLDEVAVFETALSQEQVTDIYQAASRGYNQEATGTRISNALSNAGLPISSDLMAGQRQILPVRQFGQPSLDPIGQAVEAEGGRSGFFFSGSGRATFLDRTYSDVYPYNVNQASFGDAEDVAQMGSIFYEDISWVMPEQTIANTVRVEASGGTTQEVYDLASRSKFFERTVEKTGALMVSDSDALDEASWLLAHLKDGQERVASVSFPVVATVIDPDHETQAICRELGDRITVTQRPKAGQAKSQVSHIEGIQHDIDIENQTWVTTFRLSPVTPFGDISATQEFTLQPDEFPLLDVNAGSLIEVPQPSTVSAP